MHLRTETIKITPLEKLERLYHNQYVSHTDLQDFLSRHHLTAPTKRELNKTCLKYLLSFQFGRLREYQHTAGKYYQYLNRREQLNREFIQREQKKPYQIEGNNLDPQQIEAVVACEDAELILAPAGSGKTASLLAKLNYLTDQLQIPPEDILVIAFTNKVVAELKDRVKQTNVEIRTFHSLGNKIIKSKLRGHRLITEQATRAFFHDAIKNLCQGDVEYARRYHDYLGENKVADDAAAFLNLITRSRQDPRADAEALEALFISILGLQKSEQVGLDEFKTRLMQIKNLPSRTKSLDFYNLYAPVAQKYADYLRAERLYDFADMLNLATDLVHKSPKATFEYQYILVDEAQDLSTAKYLLLKAILDNCQKVKLFAVGDDWQSIYRFAGSNLRVLDDFEQIFGRTTYRGMIELTYRFGQPTARISNKFIQQNPHQSRKKVKPHVARRTPIKVRLNILKQPRSVPQDYDTVNTALQDLYARYGEAIFDQKIQIISRYNRDIFRLVRESSNAYKNARLVNAVESRMELEWRLPGMSRPLKIPFCSMHRAKGITRDIIFVINLNTGSMGMPATRGNDAVAEVLLTKLDAHPYAEERRLFYVAITRAKHETIMVADASRISPFVFEVSPRLSGAGVRVCPRCHRGIMVEHRRKKDGKLYYSCSNFTGGCRHTEQ